MTQVVFAYLAGGWMVLAVIDQFVDREVLPLVIYEAVLTLYVVGIVGSLIVGWYHGELGEQKAPVREIVLLSVVGLIAIGAAGRVVQNSMSEASLRDALLESGLDLRRIGVLYFEDVSSDGSMQAVAEGITEGLINTFAEVRELEVTSRNAARTVRGLDLPADSIARILDVGTVVDGTVDQVGDEIRVSVRLLEGQDGIQLSRESYSWPADDVALVSSELAIEVGNSLREQLGVEVRLREGQASAPNSAAWLEVARAERLLKQADDALKAGDAQAMSDALAAAEATLILAQEAGPEWAEPSVLRAQVAYERWILTQSDDDELATLAEAVEHADAALDLEPDNAAALEWRGTANYRRFLVEAEDEDLLDQVLATARADLERSLRLDPNRASVNSTLSHLYYNVRDWAQAVLAARQAYSQDAFLSVIDQVVWRLFQGSYDLGQYDEARQWCLEGRERFPENFRFVQCQIVQLTMEEADPDVAEAWALFAELPDMMPEGDQATVIQAITQTFIGGVIGRSGLADSASVVMVRARMDPELDPSDEQISMEAAMRSVIGDVDGALERLGRYMIGHAGHFPGDHWWWDNVQGEAEFERLQFAR